MKKIVYTTTLLALGLFAGHSFAANPDCNTKAAEKKLSGAAKTSFVKKCEKDAGGDVSAVCMKSATDKKLAGAAKNSHIKKCMADGGPAKS